VPKLVTLAAVNWKFTGSGGKAQEALAPTPAGRRCMLKKSAISGMFWVNQWAVALSSVTFAALRSPLKESTRRAM